MRRSWAPRCMSPRAEFLADLGNVAAKVWMLLMLAVAWGISMSRIVDNQHHPSDVVAGMVLGVLIAMLYILRAIPRYSKVLTALPPCAARGAGEDEGAGASAGQAPALPGLEGP
jgi:membrane-associated phospholipid phosphatase